MAHDSRKITVSPALRLGWTQGKFRIGLARSSRSALLPDASIVTMLHAFATPTTVDEVKRAFGPNAPMVEQAVTDFLEAGFLVVVDEPPDEAPLEGDARPASTLAATVVMPTRDKEPYLELTLASYLGQTLDDYEILVVDDGGAGGTAALVERWAERLPVRCLVRPHGGRSAARNAALAEARGRVVVFSDDDRLVTPTFLAHHVAVHADESAPKVALGWMRGVVTLLQPRLLGALYGPVVSSLGGGAASAMHALTSPEALEKDFQAEIDRLGTPEPDWERKVTPALESFGHGLGGFQLGWFLGSTGNMSALRELVADVGGFDEGYVGYGMEDTDLCYALAKAGAPAVVLQGAVNHHQLHPKSNVSADMGRNLRFFADKWNDLGALLFTRWFFDEIDLAGANDLARQATQADAGPMLDALLKAYRAALPR